MIIINATKLKDMIRKNVQYSEPLRTIFSMPYASYKCRWTNMNRFPKNRKSDKIYLYLRFSDIDIVKIIFHYQGTYWLACFDFACNSSFNLTRRRVAWRLIKNRVIRLEMCHVSVPRSRSVQTSTPYMCMRCMYEYWLTNTLRISRSVERWLANGGWFCQTRGVHIDLGLT